MWKELRELAERLQLSTGQVLMIARELTGEDNLRTIDLLSWPERRMLIAELERLAEYEEPALV